MARGQDISIDGLDDILKKFSKMSKMPDDKEIENKLFVLARSLQKDIRRAAPKGPTGNLRKAIVARKFKRKIKHAPAVYVAVGRRAKEAPHAYLVEYGSHGLRYATSKAKTTGPGGKFRVAFIGADGQKHVLWIRHTGKMPPNPFFRNTYTQQRDRIQQGIKTETEAILKRIAA